MIYRGSTEVSVPFPRFSPLTNDSRRIIRGGNEVYAFTDHTALTPSGAEAASYTLSTVSGVNGIAAGDCADGVAKGSKTGSTAMVKLVCDGTQAGVADYQVSSALNLNVLPGDNKFGLWVYISEDLAVNSTVLTSLISLDISDDNSYAGLHYDRVQWNANGWKNGWNFLVAKLHAVKHPVGVFQNHDGSADYSAVQMKAFRLTFKIAAGKTFTCYLDSLYANFATKPSFTLGFDSAGADDSVIYTLPIMRSYGLTGYICAMATALGDATRMTNFNTAVSGTNQITNINTIYAAGFDVISHGLNHENTSDSSHVQVITPAEVQYQILAQTAWQLAHGWDRGKEFFVAPQARWDPVTNNQLKNLGIVMARQTIQGSNNTRTIWGYPNPLLMGHLQMDDPADGTTAIYSHWVDYVNMLIDYGADGFLAFHTVVANAGASLTTPTGDIIKIYDNAFDAFCSYLAGLVSAGTISVVTPTELYYGLKT